MLWKQPVSGRPSADFDQPRPLSAGRQTHVHGAVDIPAPVGTSIEAPEDGQVMYWVSIRPASGILWPTLPKLFANEDEVFPYADYFYDMFGGVIVLQADERTHVITHSYARQLFNTGKGKDIRKWWVEEPEDKRFPVSGMFSERYYVDRGDVIGYVGNAGYSTGAHIHWEVHPGYKWFRHADRLRPISS